MGERELPGRFEWVVGPPLVSPADRPDDPCHAIKDPTIVRYGGRWHLFCSIRSRTRTHQIEYLSFEDWQDADPAERHAARSWIKRIDEKVHPSAGVLTYAIGPRQMLLGRPEAAREAHITAIPAPARREARRSVIAHGVAALEFAAALGQFVALLDDMHAALASSSWLTGKTFGLADAAALPYVLRMDHLAMTPLIAARPRTAKWLAAVQARESFASAVTEWAPEPGLNLFRVQGEAVWADVEKTAASL